MSQIQYTPAKATVIYDGECRFCIARVNNIRSWDWQNQMDYLPRQGDEAEQRFPEIRNTDLEEGMLLIEPNRQVHKAADAVYQIALRLPIVKSIAWMYKLPVVNPSCHRIYRWIAKNRKRFGQTCENNACKLDHAPDQKVHSGSNKES